ncbi:MAG TPA: sigma-70 family RNA polymerase sigma factor [Bacteroidales bacterium]|nr:sigma-70 family RNA polymerase sigma factor [Bacteroidales bacterium]
MMFRDDEYYIGQVLDGQTAAYRNIVEKHQDFVFTIVHRIVASAEEAEEIAQDVFIKAYAKLSGFRGNAKFSTWLYRIAYNAAISHTRKKKVEFLPAEEHIIANHTEEEVILGFRGLTAEQQQKLIHQVMAMLPATDNLIITLFYFQEKDLEEISEIVGMTSNNVKVKLHRIRKRLLKEINDIMGRDMDADARRRIQ